MLTRVFSLLLLTAAGIVATAGPGSESSVNDIRVLSPANPYLDKAEQLVTVACGKVGKTPVDQREKVKGEAFWLTWGFTAPESRRKGNPELGKDALALTELWTSALEKKPQAYWELVPSLQTVEFWRRSGKVTPEQLALWLKRLRPSVEACYESQNRNEWINVAPNTLHQAAAGMQLAALVYGKVNPRDPDLRRWQDQARKCVGVAAKLQLPGGAFSYIRSSGPDPVYYNFDSTFLGIYYMLTQDREAGDALRRMSGWSRSVTVCGWVTAFSSPWWKHFWGTGGPFFGPEIIAGVSGDPLTAGVMEIRRRQSQPYYFMYYAMYFYNPDLKPQAVSDRCEYDANANGAALRRGGFDVEMPFRSWSESTGGAAVSNSVKVNSFVTSAILTAVKDGSTGYNKAYGVVDLNAAAHRATLCGPGWIAQAVTFHPVTGTFGSPTSSPSPWQRTDIWFADADGAAAALELQCLTANRCNRISAWVRTSSNFTGAGSRLTSPALAVELDGQLEPFKQSGDKNTVIHEARLRNAGERTYNKNETFRVKVAIQRLKMARLTIGPVEVKGGIHTVEVLKDGKKIALLVYNSGTAKIDYAVPAGCSAVWTEAPENRTVKVDRPQGKVVLPAYGLLLLQ